MQPAESHAVRIPVDAYPPGFATIFQPLLDGRLRFLARLSIDERRTGRAIVTAFRELGRGPTLVELAERARVRAPELRRVLAQLSDRDFLVYDAAAERVVCLYPFSDVPCPHRVTLAGERPLYAM